MHTKGINSSCAIGLSLPSPEDTGILSRTTLDVRLPRALFQAYPFLDPGISVVEC